MSEKLDMMEAKLDQVSSPPADYRQAVMRNIQPPIPPTSAFTKQRNQYHQSLNQREQPQQPQQQQQQQQKQHQQQQTQQQRQGQCRTQPPKSQYTDKSTPEFDHEKCFIIHSTKQDFTSISQDDVRKAIGKLNGPTMIDFIKRYKFNSADPKFIIQITKPEQVDIIIKKWEAEALGGSSARRPIQPSQHVGIIKDVPIYIMNEDLQQEVQTVFKDATVYRMRTKDGTNPQRTVKVNFNDETQLGNALANGITFNKHQLLFRVEKPYVFPPRTYNG
jgi:hypothetical protein